MFNRQPFNRGKFNRQFASRVYFDGRAEIGLAAAARLAAYRSMNGVVGIAVGMCGVPRFVFLLGGNAETVLSAGSAMSVPRTFSGGALFSIGCKDAQMIRGRVFVPEKIIIVKNTMSAAMNLAAAFKSSAEMVLAAGSNFNGVFLFTANTGIVLCATAKLNAANTLQGSVGIAVVSAGHININIPYQGHACIVLTARGQDNRVFGLRGSMHADLSVYNVRFNIFRYEHIHLPTINIPIGGELIIDTENMTVTLDGQNVMMHLCRDSEFFMLNPEVNEIMYTSSNQNNRADIRTLHKDAWL